MIMMKRILLAFFVLSMALSATAQRVYINPGHGDWGPESRPMATLKYVNGETVICEAEVDTLGFFESNTNLWKAFALQEKLVAAGYDVMMSRTENGPYNEEGPGPYVDKDESIDKPLTDICAEADLFGADYFISIHSNAYEDGVALNYPLFLHSGYDGAGFLKERDMALAAWPRHFEAFDQDHTNITRGFELNTAFAENNPNVRGCIDFYGYNLGALKHSCQGYLVEGYFHTYQPARHRALNPEWCRQEGIRYFRGIQDYYDKPDEQVGYIMGCVRSLTEMFSHDYYIPMSGTNDEFLPINGAKVVLRDASDNIVPTECYRHVARHITDQYYYTTDNNYNGIFVFENLDPGEYTLTVHAAGYKDTSMIVDVTANATVYPEIFLTKGQGTEPQIDVDVTWVLNGGKVDGTLPSKIEGSAYTLPTPTKAGYLFRGWYANAEGTGTALTTLEPGYKGTVYALWQSTSVTWQLNGGHISENKLLWEDFQKTKLKNNPLVPIENAWDVIEDVGGKAIHGYLSEREYIWLREYLWPIIEYLNLGDEGYKRWGVALNAFLNCTTYTYNAQTIDFTELGKYDSWKNAATPEIRQKVTLPNQITSEYTIPTPEKEGYDFKGWYDTNNRDGNKLTDLPVGYNDTVYAIWEKASVTTVTWELNGGHVYRSNDWLWEDFKKTFNRVSDRDFDTRPTSYEDFSYVWDASETNCYMLTPDVRYDNVDYKRYHWFGDYLWAKAWTASASTDEKNNMSSGNAWWGQLLWACLNCEACKYTLDDNKTTITVDFSVAGQPKSWRTFAIANKGSKNIAQEFYNEIILPEEIDDDYTIPTPEREGYTFQGWYDNPKGEGDSITVLKAPYAGTIYAIWQEPVPCIVAYDLNCNYLTGKMAFEFSFYANTQPTAGKLRFYNMDKEPIGEYPINYLWEGRNTVVLNAERIPALNQELIEGRDFLWEVHLEARPSTLFAEIFRFEPSEPSESFNTAYATIDNSPESDFFGSIWVANQKEHRYSDGETDGKIWRLVPERGYARDKDAFADGFEVIFRPTVAPDGKVYITDNGKSHGGVYVMDPHTPDTTDFFKGCSNHENGEWKDVKDAWKAKNGEWKDQSDEWEDYNNKVVGSGSTGAHIYWTEDGNNKNGFHPEEPKLFLMHNAHATGDDNGITKGFFVYDLMRTGPHTHTRLQHYEDQAKFNSGTISPFVNTDITDYAIVGTNRGAWVCQLRSDKGNFFSHPSLTFYPNKEGDPMPKPTIFSSSLAPSSGGIFGDNELIHGSYGAALAVNKAENLLAMVDGTGNIMLFDIEWSNDETTPTLTNKRYHFVVPDNPTTDGSYRPTITTLNFDYAGNLVATLGDTYNDTEDKHEVVIFTLPKTTNHIDVPSRFSQRVPSLVEDDQCTSIAIADKKYETVEIHRKMQKGMYNTICLPFGINSLEGTPYQGASVVKFMGTEIQTVGGEEVLKLNFEELTFQGADTMVAGVPYLIQPYEQDIKEPVRVSNVFTCDEPEYITGKSIPDPDNRATFHGITGPTQIDKDPNILFLVADNRLATAKVSGPMLGNRAYFTLDKKQNLPKRSMISIVKSTPAGFEEIYNTYQTEAYKMLYNGMIVIVRDGVMYDLMGTRIK